MVFLNHDYQQFFVACRSLRNYTPISMFVGKERNETLCVVINRRLDFVWHVASHRSFIPALRRTGDDAALTAFAGICACAFVFIDFGLLLPTDSLTLIWKK